MTHYFHFDHLSCRFLNVSHNLMTTPLSLAPASPLLPQKKNQKSIFWKKSTEEIFKHTHFLFIIFQYIFFECLSDFFSHVFIFPKKRVLCICVRQRPNKNLTPKISERNVLKIYLKRDDGNIILLSRLYCI